MRAHTSELEPVPEVPRRHRQPRRPPLAELLGRLPPGEAFARAYRDYDYRKREIAGALGCHSSTVSRRRRAFGDAWCRNARLDPVFMVAVSAARGDAYRASALLGATEAAREAMGAPLSGDEVRVRARALELLPLSATNVEQAWAEGRALDLAAAVELATKTVGAESA